LMKHLAGLRWKTDQSVKNARECPLSPTTQRRARSTTQSPDAFTHETDALDYCDEQIVDAFCYGARREAPNVPLLPHVQAFWEATRKPFPRLPEEAFEQMNGLSGGTLQALKAFCDVRNTLGRHEKLSDVSGAICLILRGFVSMVQTMENPEATAEDNLQVRGFTFRQGKRLHQRLPPGNIFGQGAFFLGTDQVLDPALEPKPVISSKGGRLSEIWVLRRELFERMGPELKETVAQLCARKLAEASRHSQLAER